MLHTPTLTQYLLRHLSAHPDQRGLTMIMSDIAVIGKALSREINRAGLKNILGLTGSTNIQGEQVHKLDQIANELTKQYLRQTGHFAALSSEEEDGVVDMGEFGKDARYVIAFDPLDGSSNIDVNVSIGTIFSVHARRDDVERTDEKQFLQTGRTQVLAGYMLYGSSTVLIFSFGDGVHEFTLDQGLGEFLLSTERIEMPEKCPYYSVNEGNYLSFPKKDQAFISYLKDQKKCDLRYIGSAVADFHRTLKKGGVFMYPAVDKEGTGQYKGKYRLNFENKPMAFLAEQAGAVVLDGEQAILDIEPTALHQRAAFIMGSRSMMEQYVKL